jgi:hypothetical protein
VRSCPLKKKDLSEKQQGKRPQGQAQANLKLKIWHFPRRFKIKLPKSRNQQRREREGRVAIFAMRRGTLLIHA